MDLFIHYNICTKTKCNKQGHIEKDCRKKQFDLKRKGKKSYPQIHSASIQNDNVNYSEEDEENNFVSRSRAKGQVEKDESDNIINYRIELLFGGTDPVPGAPLYIKRLYHVRSRNLL